MLCRDRPRPASITRSIHLRVSYDQPDDPGLDRGSHRRRLPHIVLGLPAPYPDNVAHWAASELVKV